MFILGGGCLGTVCHRRARVFYNYVSG